MESSPDYITLDDSDDEGIGVARGTPLRSFARPFPPAVDPTSITGDGVQNQAKPLVSPVPDIPSRLNAGHLAFDLPVRHPLRAHHTEVDTAILRGGEALGDAQQSPEIIQLSVYDGKDNNQEGGHGSPLQSLRRSCRLRELGEDASHPWRSRPQEAPRPRLPLVSQRVPRPRTAMSRALAGYQPLARTKEKPQRVLSDQELWRRMYTASGTKFNPGICSLCVRSIHTITAHHVHPRVNGRRRGPAGFTKKQLETHVPVCLSCHRLIHHFIPNDIMGMSYYSPHLLRSHPRVVDWINWVTRQPIPAPTEPPMTRRQIKEARRRGQKTRKGDVTGAGQARAPEIECRGFMLRAVLEKVWAEYGNTFPRWSRGSGTPEDRRSELVKKLNGRIGGLFQGPRVSIEDVKNAMKPFPAYRAWYLWLFDEFQARNGTMGLRNVRGAAPEPEARSERNMAGFGSANTVAAGMDGIVAGAMHTVSNAVEVIDLTGDDLDEDSGWADMDVDEDATGRNIVIDLTGDD